MSKITAQELMMKEILGDGYLRFPVPVKIGPLTFPSWKDASEWINANAPIDIVDEEGRKFILTLKEVS